MSSSLHGRLVTLCLLVTSWLLPRAEVTAANAPDRGVVASNGTLDLRLAGRDFAHLAIGMVDHNGVNAGAVAFGSVDADSSSRLFHLTTPGGNKVTGVASYSRGADGAVSAAYSFNAGADLVLSSLHIDIEIPAANLVGGSWKADGKSALFPMDFKEFANPTQFEGAIRSLTVTGADKRSLSLTFGTATKVLVQDNRRWVQSIFLRIETMATFKRGETAGISMQVSTPDHLELEFDK